MNRCVSRRGSALLIVLGMMAFIVVSAVAFSAYMRYSRLPSSYLRRTSASRMLVKAALAEAIEEVDASIGNNPYPGVGSRASKLPRMEGAGGNNENRNHWNHRVFIGTNRLVSVSDTVSTLTFEGLAYIPPAFVNEVRYYSRHTPTAGWQTMDYDAGRYAFCAVDVSDCLDVNRLFADAGRDSSDAGRITLAHCFENPQHTGYTVDPNVWDGFMDKYDGKPLISVADLNLGLGHYQPNGIVSPFCDYIQQSQNAKFVTDDSDSAAAELRRGMAFVTDSLFPATNTVSTTLIDLARVTDQPFYGMAALTSKDATKNADTFDRLVEDTNEKFRSEMSPAEIAQLYDYLDRDSVPLSLALPSVERVPMVTGVGLSGSVSLIVDKEEKDFDVGTPDPQGKCDRIKITVGALKLAGEIGVRAGFVYPFKYSRGQSASFKAQAAATVTLVPKDSEQELRRTQAKFPAVIGRGEWATSKKNPTAVKFGSEETPVCLSMLSETKSLPVKTVTEEEDAVLTDLTFSFQSFSQPLVTELPDDPLMSGAGVSDDKFKKTTFRKIVKTYKDGRPSETSPVTTNLRVPNAAMSDVVAMAQGGKYVPVIQVWVRILDKNDKVVDLVPAYFKDDETTSARLTDIRSAAQLPVLRFFQKAAADVELTYDDTVFAYGTKEMTPYPQAYLADDPRFNHSPENLIAVENLGGDFKTKWFAEQRSKARDGDILMATSDAGYMQSVFEISFLNDMDLAIVNADSYNGKIRTDFASTPANKAMWNTYSQIKVGASAGGDVTDVLPFVEGGRGFRVNPFTDDLNVMMTALANTPMDWWAASTNVWGDTVKQQMVDSLATANKYTFSEHAGAQVQVKHGTRANPDNTLTQLAKNLMANFRSRADGNWQAAFDDLDWNTEDQIGGVDLGVTLHAVDKKYLHAYWRSCFANRQHLFLIFVRAEPMMMGGGGMGQTPPQLGARAVALVWRDPTPTETDIDDDQPRPHRTRVLFYRQFE